MKRNRCCTLCNNSTYVSSCNYQCQTYYCHLCRNVPASKTKCPKGHNFHVHNKSSTITCDLCGLNLSSLKNKLIYADRQCNFDICASCI